MSSLVSFHDALLPVRPAMPESPTGSHIGQALIRPGAAAPWPASAMHSQPAIVSARLFCAGSQRIGRRGPDFRRLGAGLCFVVDARMAQVGARLRPVRGLASVTFSFVRPRSGAFALPHEAILIVGQSIAALRGQASVKLEGPYR